MPSGAWTRRWRDVRRPLKASILPRGHPALLRADPGVHQGLIVVSLADFSDTSLRVQISISPPIRLESHMVIRERVNFGILRACAARGRPAVPDPVIRMDAPKPLRPLKA